MKSTNPRDVAYIFRDYSRKIHARALPDDPSFLRLSVACGRIEQWCERHYPSFVRLQQVSGGVQFDPLDVRTRVVHAATERDRALAKEKRMQEYRERVANGKGNGALGEEKRPAQEEMSTVVLMLYVAGGFLVVLAITLGFAWVLLNYFQ